MPVSGGVLRGCDDPLVVHPHHRDHVDANIAELQRLKAGLTECIGCGCLSLDRCKLTNPDDPAARLGSGPRYWLGDAPE